MRSLIFCDLKKRMKSPITWLLIWIILMTSYFKIDEIKTERLYRNFIEKYDTSKAEMYISYKDDEYFWNANDKTRAIMVDTSEKLLEAEKRGDYKSYNKHEALLHLISAKLSMSNDIIQITAAENQIKEIWDDVSDGIKYEDTNIAHWGMESNALVEFSQLYRAKLHHYLFINDLEVIYEDDLNNINFAYKYVFDILPLFLIISTILLMYNSINKEVNNESAKLILTQSIPRWEYYISKYISALIHVLFIVYTPFVFVNPKLCHILIENWAS